MKVIAVIQDIDEIEHILGHLIKGRYFVLGQTDDDRALFVAYTLRGDLIRVISARDMSRREKKVNQG